MNQGAMAPKSLKDRPEIETILTKMHEGNMQLESIQSRLISIRDNLYGSRPTAVTKEMKETAPSGSVPAMRDHVERGANLRQNINELLSEIESFI